MNFLENAKSRYTTKKYNPNLKISEEKIEQLKEILRLSPSSINSQPWTFGFIADEKVKRELASVSYFNEQRIIQASHLVVFSVIDEIEKFEEQIQQNLHEGAIDYYITFVKPNSEPETKSRSQHQD